MSNQDDPFALTTGVKDDYDSTIVDAWFGTRESSGQTLFLFLKQNADDGEEVERRYSCGSDWASYDGGKTAENPKSKGFGNNSNIGKLVTAAFGSGAEDELRKRSAALGGLGPKAADLWKNLRFHWNAHTETYNFPDKDTGQMVARESVTVLPSKFLGVAGEGDGQSAPSTPSPAAPSADPLSTLDAETAAKVKVLAKANEFPAWVDAVMALDGVVTNDAMMASIGDEDFYKSLR